MTARVVRRIVAVLLVVGLGRGAVAGEGSPKWTEMKRSEHARFLVHRDVHGVTQEQVDRLAARFESARADFLRRGFRTPLLPEGSDRSVVANHAFSESQQFRMAYTNRSRRVLHIRPEALPHPEVEEALVHELFHTIQYAYDLAEERWILEATAQWATSTVVPNGDYVKRERRFLARPQDALHGVPAEDATSRTGRPYGTSTWFRTLASHVRDPDAVLLRILDGCGRTPGPNGLEAVGGALGDASTLGRNFREIHRRFVAGAMLLDKAPADVRLADVERLGRIPERLKDVDPLVTPLFAPLLRKGATSGGKLEKTARVAGLGTRYLRFRPPAGLPAGTWFEVSSTASTDDVALRACVRRKGTWTFVEPASDGTNRVRIADLDAIEGSAAIALTRYSTDTEPASVPVAFETGVEADPRQVVWVLSKATVAPPSKEVSRWVWSGPPAPGGAPNTEEMQLSSEGSVEGSTLRVRTALRGRAEVFSFDFACTWTPPPRVVRPGPFEVKTVATRAGGRSAPPRTWPGDSPEFPYAWFNPEPTGTVRIEGPESRVELHTKPDSPARAEGTWTVRLGMPFSGATASFGLTGFGLPRDAILYEYEARELTPEQIAEIERSPAPAPTRR
jgi:hypothetical protein